MTTLLKPALHQPIGSLQDLLAYLNRGARPKNQWGIGIELENLVLEAATGEAAGYARIEQLLRRLREVIGWQGLREGNSLIGLQGPTSSITLEPGGQLELSGELCRDLHCCSRGHLDFLRDITQVGNELGLIFCGLGLQPFTPLDRIDWVPKARYAVMGPYMERCGDMGLRMMKQSAGLQVNVDFSDPADCLRKMRLAMSLSPLLYAVFANSPIMEDRPTGFLSTRGEIWSRTDPDRTGLIERLFDPAAGLADYVDYALHVPMYFIHRDQRLIDLTGRRFTFGEFLRDGYLAHQATLADWDLHLSTLFPEVRLRPQIEIRSADSLPPQFALAVGALLKGVLYDPQAAEDSWALFRDLTAPERDRLYRQAWRLGLRAPWRQGLLQELAVTVLQIARAGLQRQNRRNARGEDEAVFLDEIIALTGRGETLAQHLLDRWQGGRAEKLKLLRAHCGLP